MHWRCFSQHAMDIPAGGSGGGSGGPAGSSRRAQVDAIVGAAEWAGSSRDRFIRFSSRRNFLRAREYAAWSMTEEGSSSCPTCLPTRPDGSTGIQTRWRYGRSQGGPGAGAVGAGNMPGSVAKLQPRQHSIERHSPEGTFWTDIVILVKKKKTRKEANGGVNGRKSREWRRRKLARSRRRPSIAHIESAGHESFCGAPALSPSRSHIPDARQHPEGSVPAEPVPCAILLCRRPCFHWSSFRTRWLMCKGFSPNVASPASHR